MRRYILWQVLFPVHTFASKYLGTELSLESICETLGVDVFLGKVRRSIRDDEGTDLNPASDSALVVCTSFALIEESTKILRRSVSFRSTL